MEKLTYNNFPEKIEVFKEEDAFILYCAACGLDLLHHDGRKPYVGTENLLRSVATAHNRESHWYPLTSKPSLTLLKGGIK
jgi:hypothetical protein